MSKTEKIKYEKIHNNILFIFIFYNFHLKNLENFSCLGWTYVPPLGQLTTARGGIPIISWQIVEAAGDGLCLPRERQAPEQIMPLMSLSTV